MATPERAAAGGHWSDGYYGPLYLDSVEGLLGPRLSALEATRIAELLGLRPGDRVLDLCCGAGRHARLLAGRVGWLLGLERSPEALALARAAQPGAGAPALLRADLRALPLRAGAFDAVYSWYASLFMYDEAGNEAVLREAGRLLRRGGRLLVHHANPLALERNPLDTARRTLPDGGAVEEVSAFDPASGIDRCARRLRRPDGRTLEGTAELRYYRPTEWGSLAERAGLRLTELTSTAPPRTGGAAEEAPDLIALLEKP